MQTSDRLEANVEMPVLTGLLPAFDLPEGRTGTPPTPVPDLAGTEDSLPVGIRIALAVGLRPGGERGYYRRKSKSEQELALVGGLARTLARGPGAQTAAL